MRVSAGIKVCSTSWVVIYLTNYSAFPRATLIHDDLLLTAAHCQGLFSVAGAVYIGGVLLSGDDAIDNIPVIIEYPHPKHNIFTVENDIMVVKLAGSSAVTPAALNFDPDSPLHGEDVTAAGFGATSNVGEIVGNSSDILLKVTVPIVDFATCEAQYEPLFGPGTIVDEVMLCAGLPGVGGMGGTFLTATYFGSWWSILLTLFCFLL
jgi:secreted trypsin-like serine protease